MKTRIRKRNRKTRKGGAPKTYTIKYLDELKSHRPTHKSIALLKKKEIGYFSISEANNSTWNMNISVDDEYQGKNLAAELIRMVCDHAKFEDDQKIYIDANANTPFWVTKLKMKPNPTYDSKDEVEGAGYELVMTFKELKDWAHSTTKK